MELLTPSEHADEALRTVVDLARQIVELGDCESAAFGARAYERFAALAMGAEDIDWLMDTIDEAAECFSDPSMIVGCSWWAVEEVLEDAYDLYCERVAGE